MPEDDEGVATSEDAPPATPEEIADRLGMETEAVLEALEPSGSLLSLPDVDQHEFSRLSDILHFAEENTITTHEQVHLKDLKKKLIHEAEKVKGRSEPPRPIPFYVIKSAMEGASKGHEYAVIRSDNDYQYASSLDEANRIAADMRSEIETVSPYNHSVQVIDLQEPEA